MRIIGVGAKPHKCHLSRHLKTKLNELNAFHNKYESNMIRLANSQGRVGMINEKIILFPNEASIRAMSRNFSYTYMYFQVCD